MHQKWICSDKAAPKTLIKHMGIRTNITDEVRG